MLYGVFIATRVPGQSECWTRVGPRFVKVQTALRRALQIDPDMRGKAEIRNLQTDRTVWIAGVWLNGERSAMYGLSAAQTAARASLDSGADSTVAAHAAFRVLRRAQSGLAYA